MGTQASGRERGGLRFAEFGFQGDATDSAIRQKRTRPTAYQLGVGVGGGGGGGALEIGAALTALTEAITTGVA